MVRIQLNEYFVQLLTDGKDPAFLQLISTVKGIEKMRTRDTYRCSLHKLPEIMKILRSVDCVEQLPEGSLARKLYAEETQRRSITKAIKQGGWYDAE